jgi:toxin CcdB
MPQFALYQNRNPASRKRFPLLLDIQSDLLEVLATRVVVSLAPASAALARSMRTLTPILKFEGKEFLMLTPQVAGIPARALGPVAGDLASDREKMNLGREWSGRWESNPHRHIFRAFKTSDLIRWRMPSVISVRIFALCGAT